MKLALGWNRMEMVDYYLYGIFIDNFLVQE